MAALSFDRSLVGSVGSNAGGPDQWINARTGALALFRPTGCSRRPCRQSRAVMRYLAWCLRGAAAREVSVQYRLHWRTRQRRFKCAFRHSRALLTSCAAVHSTAAQEAIDDGLFWAMLAHTILLRTQVALPVRPCHAGPVPTVSLALRWGCRTVSAGTGGRSGSCCALDGCRV